MNIHNLTKNEKLGLMGKKVFINKVFSIKYPMFKRKIIAKDIPPKTGWIVGFSHLLEGTLEEESSFQRTKTIPCVKVAINLQGSIQKIPIDGYVLL